jgi:hypothetical protein
LKAFKPRASRQVFDPLLGRLVAESSTTSERIRSKLTAPYEWCFCELCGHSTEYATAIEAQSVFKRLRKGHAKAVPLTDAIRAEASQEADTLVARYEQALTGKFGPHEPGRLIAIYCDIREMRGDWSVETFRDQVERLTLISSWARRGDLLSAARLPGQPENASKPSKLYCMAHNPKRSDEARRAYQRDRRYAAEYADLIAEIWSKHAHELPGWDIEAHAFVRREAYRQLQALKTPTKLIDDLLKQGITNQAEIARQLGISRQAVSAAMKRKGQVATL